jgi:hypothetical protein
MSATTLVLTRQLTPNSVDQAVGSSPDSISPGRSVSKAPSSDGAATGESSSREKAANVRISRQTARAFKKAISRGANLKFEHLRHSPQICHNPLTSPTAL